MSAVTTIRSRSSIPLAIHSRLSRNSHQSEGKKRARKQEQTFEDELGEEFQDFRRLFNRKQSGLLRILDDRESSWFDRQVSLWLKGEYRPMLFSSEDIEANTEAVLLLLLLKPSSEKK